MLPEIRNRLIEVGVEFLLSGSADDSRPRAVAAVSSATVGDKKEDSVGIAVHQSWHGHMAILAARISHLDG